MNYADLIAKLEKATGQDRDLDARICYAIKPALHRMGTLTEWLATDAAKRVPAYTWSLDDALTLVPEGASWLVRAPAGAYPSATIFGPPLHGDQIIARTPAIALCIAALKAIEALRE